MSFLSIQVTSASIKPCAAIPIHAHLVDARNYKHEVLNLLEYKALAQPVPSLSFNNLTINALPFLITMANYYNLTFYAQCKLYPRNVQLATQLNTKYSIPGLSALIQHVVDDNAQTASTDGPQ